MNKVSFLDKRVIKSFLSYTSLIAMILSLVLIFVTIPSDMKVELGKYFIIFLAVFYMFLWRKANVLKEIKLDVDGSTVIVKAGDIFEENGFKAIAFNEYFDTKVDDKIIASNTLNGIFIKQQFPESTAQLDEHIDEYLFDEGEVLEENSDRKLGKKRKYRIGTICVYEEYLLTAFSKFDDKNRATLTMPEYLEFLINFWDQVNRVYAQKNVSVPIFGSGITRIKEHKGIMDEELLKIMLWTFKISEMRFKYPAKLSIIIHRDKMDTINLFDIKSSKNGL
ncbi:TPA: macro domain-containing protein [Photobacterium damselae]